MSPHKILSHQDKYFQPLAAIHSLKPPLLHSEHREHLIMGRRTSRIWIDSVVTVSDPLFNVWRCMNGQVMFWMVPKAQTNHEYVVPRFPKHLISISEITRDVTRFILKIPRKSTLFLTTILYNVFLLDNLTSLPDFGDATIVQLPKSATWLS